MSKKKKTYTQRFTRFGLKPMSIGVDQLRKQHNENNERREFEPKISVTIRTNPRAPKHPFI